MSKKKKKAGTPRKRYMRGAPKKKTKKRQRGLSEMSLVKGKYGKYANPIIEGSIGGAAMQVATQAIPDKWFDDPSMAENENLIKAGIMGLLALGAAHMGQPLVAAGIAGATTVIVMQKQGILQEGGSRRRLKSTRFADDRLLSDARLLSARRRMNRAPMRETIYAEYDPLYDGYTF